MKRITTPLAVALLSCLLFASAASAKVKTQLITFGQDFVVGDTTVKAGTYAVSFDEQKNELTVSDKKTKAVIAKAEARAAARQSDSRRLDVQLVGSGPQVLASVAFPGEKQAAAVARTTAQGN
jgi:hypothetical protein